MDAEKNIRAFLAIEPPEDVLAAIARLQEKLKREMDASAKQSSDFEVLREH
jgi:2'-5' RNA ligase